MRHLLAVSIASCLVIVFFWPAPVSSEERAPGVRIERAPSDAATETRASRLLAWRELYQARLAPVRRSSGLLFAELERSSLAALRFRCRELRAAVGRVDRAGLFTSGEIGLDRMLFGALERYRVGAGECLAGRYLEAYRLLVEARTGLQWVDRRLVDRLRPRVPLRGLGPG